MSRKTTKTRGLPAGSPAENGKPGAGEPPAIGDGRTGVARGNGGAPGNGRVGVGQAQPPAADIRRVAADLGQAVLVETSTDTAAHSDDVELIAEAICARMGLSGRTLQDVLAAARLHDIGKSAVSREILEKPGPLDEDEWDQMRRHTIVGERILASVRELKGIARLVRNSHERWDGRGYPDGLAGEEIPLGSRIIFCADAFHAVRSDRPYQRGSSAKAALAEVKRCAGTQFDPTVVSALEEAVGELRLIEPTHRARRSSRLAALLLILALGAGGSAVGRSDLLGPVPSGSGGPELTGPVACPGGDCALTGPLLTIQFEGLGLPVPGNLTGPSSAGSFAAIDAAGVVRDRSQGRRKKARRTPKSSGIAAPVVTPPAGVGQGGSEGGGSSGSGGSSKPSRPRGPKPGRGKGRGVAGTPGAPGGASAPGTGNGNANPGSWAGGGSPGSSGNAPGHNK